MNTPVSSVAASTAGINRSSSSVQRFLWVTIVLVVAVVVWGAVVRLTSSGLSIPDWPLINGSLLPPFSEAGWEAVQEDYRLEAIRLGKTGYPADLTVPAFRTAFWIEYMHRALAATVGLVFFWAMFQGFRNQAVKQKVEVNFFILAALLLAQAGLGGVVVIGALHSALVAIHLVVAYCFFALLIWTVLALTRREHSTAGGSRSAGFQPINWALITAVLTLLQVAVGGLVAGTGAASILNTYPLMAGSIIPPSDLLWNPVDGSVVLNGVLVQFVHRWLPFLLLVAFIVLRFKTLRTPLGGRAVILFRATAALLGLQIIVGIFNLLYRAPVILSALHSGIALLFFGGMVVILHDLRYEAGEGAR